MRSIRFSDQVFSDECPSFPSSRRINNIGSNLSIDDESGNFDLRELPPHRRSNYSSLPRRKHYLSSYNTRLDNGSRGNMARSYALDYGDEFDEIDFREKNRGYIRKTESTAELYKTTSPNVVNNGGMTATRDSILKNGSGSKYQYKNNGYNSMDRVASKRGILSSSTTKTNSSSSSFNNESLRRKRENFKTSSNGSSGRPLSQEKEDNSYPELRKPASTVQIIATPHRPCCSKLRSSIILTLILVVLIFTILSSVGVLLFYNGGLNWSFIKDKRVNLSNAKQQHTRLHIGNSCEEGKPCPYGGTCMSTGNSSLECECIESCPYTYTPVCGSDHVTYDNECKLKLASCKKKKYIKKAHSGVCGVNSCLKLSCPDYSKCVPSYDGSSANCVCPKPCKDSNNKSTIVCGSDGHDYPSECHLQRSACIKRMSGLKVRYKGLCNPCSSMSCDPERFQECHVLPVEKDAQEYERVPKCICNNDCPEKVFPVCASNGLTYQNECNMKLDACRRLKDLHIVYPGECSMGVNPCKLLNCDWGQECEISKQGITNCVCPSNCEPIVRPVCGSDRVTYENMCSLKKNACEKQKNISPVHYGSCGSNGPCSKRKCNHNSICVESGDLAFCECPSCDSLEYSPVCGTNGKIYNNECHLNRDACLKEDYSLKKGEMKLCNSDSCVNVICDFHGFCDKGECICQSSCQDDSENEGPVCGSDNVTYSSECQLKATACREKRNIMVASAKKCDPCQGVTCEHGAKCLDGVCVCPTHCPRHEDTLCGSDYITYLNECELLKSSCESESKGKKAISLRHRGSCELSTEPSISLIKPTHQVQSSGLYYKNQYFSRPTQTSITIHGRIGDFCINDQDCSVSNSQCSSKGECICNSGYKENNERYCSLITVDENKSPCSSKPCFGGGTCEEHDGTFTCFCPSNRVGNQCDMELSAHEPSIPLFNGVSSYVELVSLDKVDHKISIGVEFKSFDRSGVLFYAQQFERGDGDFISLAIVDGYIEFRYNLGDGPVSIISSKEIKLNSWHKIQAKRWHKDGILKMDDLPDVRGQTKGSLRSLDILSHSYIGGYSKKSNKQALSNSGTAEFFSGCIREFKLGHKEIKIQSAMEPKSKKRVDLRECQNSECKSNPCKNGGRCVEDLNGKYLCLCKNKFSGPECQEEKNACFRNPCKGGGECIIIKSEPHCQCSPGRKGKFCELVTLSDESALNFIPSFNSKSYIELPTLRHVSKSFEIQVWFLSHQPNGMILYNGQNTNGHGDFLSLNLVNKRVQYRYDLGSGIANLTSKETVQIGVWHKIKITRNGPHGSLQLDEGEIVRGSSYAPLTELNLNLPLYLGGFKFSYTLSRNAGIVIGLDGAIQSLSVNGYLVEDLMEHAKDSKRISRFSGPPCNNHKCLNGGICKPLFKSYTCRCRANYIGNYCEKHLKDFDDKAVHFDGQTFLKFMNRVSHSTNKTNLNSGEQDVQFVEWEEEFDSDDHQQIGQIIDDFDSDEESNDIYGTQRGETNNKFTVHLRTTQSDGLLIWTHQGSSLKGDFLAVTIVNGYPELRYKLGEKQSTVRITSKTAINDGKWHRLKVIRKRRIGLIQVDKLKPVRGKSGIGASVLNTNGKVWIGGKDPLPPGFSHQYSQGFIGCIKKAKIFRKPLDILRHGSNIKLCEA